MGLLDWLTDSIGGAGGGQGSSPFVSATNAYQGPGVGSEPPTPAPGTPLPTARPPMADAMQGQVPLPMARPPGANVPLGPPPGSAGMVGRGMGTPPMPPDGGGMPQVDQLGNPIGVPGPQNIGPAPAPPPPVPLPASRPPGAGPGANALPPEPVRPPGAGGMIGRPMPGGPEDPAALPPGATSTQGVGTPGQPQQPYEATWLGKMMGVKSPEDAKRIGQEISRGMAAAFKNAPSGIGQSKFGAFAGGVGAGMTGAQAEADRREESQRKDIAQMILTKNSEGQQTLNLARTKLALEQAKAVMTGQGQGINSPQQLYFAAQRIANQDQDVKSARTALDEIKKNYKPDAKEIKDAQAKFDALLEERRNQHMIAAGLDPKLGKSIASLPGMSEATALKGDRLTPQSYENMPVGGYYINPKTGTLMRKGSPFTGAGGPATPPTAAPPTAAPPTGAGTPPTPPAPVTAPAGSRAAAEDDNVDEDVG